jgi:hypothetical protein
MIKINPVHITPAYPSEIHLNIIQPSPLGLPSGFPRATYILAFFLDFTILIILGAECKL